MHTYARALYLFYLDISFGQEVGGGGAGTGDGCHVASTFTYTGVPNVHSNQSGDGTKCTLPPYGKDPGQHAQRHACACRSHHWNKLLYVQSTSDQLKFLGPVRVFAVVFI